ncbi:thioredoxin-like protein [Clathrospora elynae]|uniref:Thioredoxin-like protein n=1 Tax=Clathrospora elynae TaxID=706981 RepID=A0A6A5SBZ0_9PLEO|nr:thioredoxin-like protein [Clathrospora elynae]
MPYESTITFTLDTICPWTYLGFLRLNKALNAYRSANPDAPATFTLRLSPYQLYPGFTQEGEDKYEWYKKEKYNGSEDRMKMYMAYMSNLGREEGIEFDFGGGMVANTLHAHRILLYLQKNKTPGVALKALESLYGEYFCRRAHPSSPQTLLKACRAAGLEDEEAKKLVEDGEMGLRETERAVRVQAVDGVDSVPYIIFEGRKRDFTLVGAKKVEEYAEVLKRVGTEAV